MRVKFEKWYKDTFGYEPHSLNSKGPKSMSISRQHSLETWLAWEAAYECAKREKHE